MAARRTAVLCPPGPLELPSLAHTLHVSVFEWTSVSERASRSPTSFELLLSLVLLLLPRLCCVILSCNCPWRARLYHCQSIWPCLPQPFGRRSSVLPRAVRVSLFSYSKAPQHYRYLEINQFVFYISDERALDFHKKSLHLGFLSYETRCNLQLCCDSGWGRFLKVLLWDFSDGNVEKT